jgi:RNA polymerase sigma-70 factor (ECF subfamily)
MEECIPSGMSVETELEAKELTSAINRFLDTLSREDRFLFVRRYWYADAVSQLAAMTGGSPNRVSLRLWRIREKLRKMLKKEGFTV